MSTISSRTLVARRTVTLTAAAATLGLAGLLPVAAAVSAVPTVASPFHGAAGAVANPRLLTSTLPTKIQVQKKYLVIPFVLTYSSRITGVEVILVNKTSGRELAYTQIGPGTGSTTVRGSSYVNGTDAFDQSHLVWEVTSFDAAGNLSSTTTHIAAAGRGKTRIAIGATRAGTLITLHGRLTSYNNTRFVESADRGIVVQRLAGTEWVSVKRAHTSAKGAVAIKVREAKGTHLRLVALAAGSAWPATSRIVVA